MAVGYFGLELNASCEVTNGAVRMLAQKMCDTVSVHLVRRLPVKRIPKTSGDWNLADAMERRSGISSR